MNTNPDEATLALWLDDELAGSELATIEAWAAGQPRRVSRGAGGWPGAFSVRTEIAHLSHQVEGDVARRAAAG